MTERVDAEVVICSWAGDERALVLATLEAVSAQLEPERIHLVDMSPSADLADRARELGVAVQWTPGSSGLGESRQTGLAGASCRYVAFLDSDAVPRPGWLRALRAAAEPPDVAVAGGPVLPVWPAERRLPLLFRTAVAGDFLSMLDLGPRALDTPRVLPGNMLVDRELTGEAVFSAELGRTPDGLVGAEEIEMMLRVREEGRRIVYEPAAGVDHRTRAERMSWRWMWRRARAAGMEAALIGVPLEPLPRRLGMRDRAMLGMLAPAYLYGRRTAARRS
jgi:Glycosyl transferase family 2